nr:hypothetical protein [Tanacetum cinerariifolium]
DYSLCVKNGCEKPVSALESNTVYHQPMPHSPTKKGRKDKPHVIPYCRFTKLIICHLGRIHNIHPRSASPFHLAEEDLKLGRKKKPITAKQPKPKPAIEKSSKPSSVPKPKATKEKPTKRSPVKPSEMGKVLKTRKGKSSLQLIDEEEPSQPEPEPEPEHQEPVAKATQPLPVVKGKGKTIATENKLHNLCWLYTRQKEEASRINLYFRGGLQPRKRDQLDPLRNYRMTHQQILFMSLRLLQMLKQVLTQTRQPVEEKTTELDQGQARSDPGKTPESRPLPDQEFMEEDQAGPDPGVSRVALAGPNLESTHKEFMATVYPDVHGSLKLPVDEHVFLEEPLSSSGTLSSMKNLDDAYTFKDHFLNEKSTEDELGKLNMDSEVVSMVTVLIHQASSSVPPLSTPIIDLSHPQSHLNRNSLPWSKSKTLDSTTQNLRSRVFNLELRDLPHKIDQIVNTVVKEVVHIALQAPLKDRFKELPEADIKEILHQRMFESGSYKLLPEHVAFYEALEASMDRANRDEFLAEMDKSRKRRRDDQDPPPPPPGLDLIKRKRHDSGASEEDRPATPEPDWVIPPNELSEPENNWANILASSYQDPDECKLLRQTVPDVECHRMLLDQVNLVNPEGHRIMPDIRKPLPLGGPPESLTGGSSIKNSTSLDMMPPLIAVKADYKEYKILEADFKILHPNDFEDLYLLHLQDYTIVSKPRAVIYRDRNDQKKMMQETEVHKFSNGTLNRILEKLDHMVKDFRLFMYNPGITTRIWSEDDRRRSKEFMEVIEHRLKLRRIFRNLESFVQVKMEMEIPRSSGVYFITACSYLTDTSKEPRKIQVVCLSFIASWYTRSDKVSSCLLDDGKLEAKKQLVLEMFVDESLEMIMDESLDMIEDESLDMIVDESFDTIVDESLMVEDKSLEKLVDETLKLDEEHFESMIADCKVSHSC